MFWWPEGSEKISKLTKCKVNCSVLDFKVNSKLLFQWRKEILGSFCFSCHFPASCIRLLCSLLGTQLLAATCWPLFLISSIMSPVLRNPKSCISVSFFCFPHLNLPSEWLQSFLKQNKHNCTVTAYAADIFFLLRNPHPGGTEKLLSFTRYRICHSAWAASIGHLVPQVGDFMKEMENVLFLYELKWSWGGDCS